MLGNHRASFRCGRARNSRADTALTLTVGSLIGVDWPRPLLVPGKCDRIGLDWCNASHPADRRAEHVRR